LRRTIIFLRWLHQNLDGRSPVEVRRGIDVFRKGFDREYWFEGWAGLFTGYYQKQ
jgi:hypothetical protein